jgi:hypothetical protein
MKKCSVKGHYKKTKKGKKWVKPHTRKLIKKKKLMKNRSSLTTQEMWDRGKTMERLSKEFRKKNPRGTLADEARYVNERMEDLYDD